MDINQPQTEQPDKNMFSTGSNNIFVDNPNLKTLLIILIAVFLLSGIGLAIFQQWSNNYREQVYQQTQAGLPTHQIKSPTTPTEVTK